MKRIVASILLLIYFAVSTGLIISTHYCMGELDSTEIGYVASDTCGRCGMETDEANGCCHDEFKVVKLDTDQLVAKILQANFNLSLVLHTNQTDYLLSPFRDLISEDELIAHSPPLLSEQDTYLQNRVFRI
jgi:hypothetical protein